MLVKLILIYYYDNFSSCNTIFKTVFPSSVQWLVWTASSALSTHKMEIWFLLFLNTGSQRKKRLSWPNMQYLNCVAKLPYTSVPSSVLSSVPSCCLLHFVDVYKYGMMTSFLFLKKQEPFLILPLLLLFSCCLEENLQVFVFKSTCLI